MKKRSLKTMLLIIGGLLAIGGGRMRKADAQTSGGDIVGHVIAGYQGWLCEPGDGSPVGNLAAGNGNYHDNYETYPDLREFPDSEQFAPPSAKAWGSYPNGNPARLFSSDRDFTAALHARWMRQYGIDVAALQRFSEAGRPGVNRDQKNDVTRRMMGACQKNGVKFYIEFDTSGSGHGDWGQDFALLKKDWMEFAVGENIVNSPAYARQNGKPVVELWGMGLRDNGIETDPAKWLALLHWFQSQGVYVIAGTATNWRTGTADGVAGFESVFASCDAINPWIVGRFSDAAGADLYAREKIMPDLAWCRAHKIDYIPGVYPGTSFHNSDSQRPKNIVPRRHGELLWRQFANLRNAGISTCFVAMFDEYNEATNLAKSAENASMTPAGQWFLTLDAEGGSLSSDFYLRLTADAGKMLKKQAALQWTMPTPARNDLFTTSFETGSIQTTSESAWENKAKNMTNVHCDIRTEKAQSGASALRFSGAAAARGGTKTSYHRKIFDFSRHPLTIGSNTLLYYWLNPQDENGRYVAIDIRFTDGTALSDRKNIVDQNALSLRASNGHGGKISLNSWHVVTSNLGALSGKRIDSIYVVFDCSKTDGSFLTYLDDIALSQ